MGWQEWLGIRPTQDRFARRLLALLNRYGEWQWDATEAVIRNNEGAVLHVGNLYLEYAQARLSERTALLQKYCSVAVASTQQIPIAWPVAARAVHAVVRSRHDGMISAIEARAQGTAMAEAVSWPFVDDLVIRLVYDHGQWVSHVTEETAAAWGCHRDAMRACAIGNLAALPAPSWREMGHGIYQLFSEAGYAESLLLVDKVIDALPFAAHAVCVACNRGVLLAADGRDDAAVRILIACSVDSMTSQPWPVSSALLQRTGAGWGLYTPTQALQRQVANHRRQRDEQLYDEQKAALEQLHAKTETDVFVASYLVRTAQAGRLVSLCTWAEGVPSLLPRTDQIALTRRDASFVLVDWDVVDTHAGRHLKPTQDDPPRFAVDSFPDADELAALSAQSVELTQVGR